jgi:hypothetical protein
VPEKLEPRPFAWRPLAVENLPPAIKLFEGDAVNADGQVVRAWYVDVDYSDAAIQARAVLSQTPLGRETTSSLAKASGAIVAVNGGYFDMKAVPAKTYSVVLSGGQLKAKNIEAASRPNGKYLLTRSAFGVRADRSMDVTWLAHLKDEQGEKLWSYPSPSPNTYAQPAPAPTKEFPLGGSAWDAVEAIGGAPVLVEGGQVKVTAEAEAIPRNMDQRTHPRTVLGWAGGNRMLLFVCDGRQKDWSMGLKLGEVAAVMRDLGCVEALNLDGGGSTTLVVNGQVINKPSDGRERNVTTIWALMASVPVAQVPNGR